MSRLLLAALWAVTIAGLPCAAYGYIQFEEATATAGLNYIGYSWGASWGDINGDSWPDLWLTNHLQVPSLHLNNGDGTFVDVIAQVFSADPGADTHGGAWADFDNDGDQDLLVVVGAQQGIGEGPNLMLVNENGVLVDKAVELGLDYPLGRSRTPLWFDWNQDGRLDVIVSARARADSQVAPTALFEYDAALAKYMEVPEFSQKNIFGVHSQLLWLDGYHAPAVAVHYIASPEAILEFDQGTINDLASVLGFDQKVTDVWDTAIADFNGDTLLDLFMTRMQAPIGASDASLVNDNEINIRLVVNTNEKGISFSTAGPITFSDINSAIELAEIYIGAEGSHPSTRTFTLNPEDSSVQGIKPHTAGLDEGIYIGHDTETGKWQVLNSAPRWVPLEVIVTSGSSIQELATIGFEPQDFMRPDKLFAGANGQFEDVSTVSGFGESTSCQSVVQADFDNDMDVDIYMACASPTINLPNVLYENVGGGVFIKAQDAGGAAGAALGRAETVVTADYDLDGYPDLFVTNGQFHDQGPSQLFHNKGSGNHWIEIDLEGVTANKDGIGALVYVTTGGITQVRQQDGGMHRFAQNHKRIHLGLGSNDTVDEILVRWPSGIVQRLQNVSSDRIMTVTEPSASVSVEDVIIDERAGIAEITFTLASQSEEPVTVDYAVVDVTTTAGEDYILPSGGQIVFLPGEFRKTVGMTIVLDAIAEPDETFEIRLSNVTNGSIEKAVATATITRLPIWFTDNTEAAGVSFTGQSRGSSWGDFDGDHCPDLWVSHHYEAPSLYRNGCNGTFVDIRPSAVDWDPDVDDSHGAAWGDFDNDGDQDLIEVSGDYLNIVYVNQGNSLSGSAAPVGVGGCGVTDACPWAREMTPLWVDWNKDGLLDLVLARSTNSTKGHAPSVLLEQLGPTPDFLDVSLAAGFDVAQHTVFAQLSDLSGDGELDLVVHGLSFPTAVYDMATSPLSEISADLQLPALSRVRDVVLADFDGDLLIDVFVAQGKTTDPDINQLDAQTLNLRLRPPLANEQGVTFMSEGSVTFELQPFLRHTDAFIGATGFNPPATGFPSSAAERASFTLSPNDPSVWGIPDHLPGVTDGIFIGYDPASRTWTLLCSVCSSFSNSLLAQIVGTTPLFHPTLVNFAPFSSSKPSASLLLNRPAGFLNVTSEAGLGVQKNCYGASAGDFDNDMDMDVYLVCNRPAGNVENLLFANNGDGSFDQIPIAGGAGGSLFGKGDTASIADYDLDGFLDIYVTNSDDMPPFVGPHQLFRNTGNSNHWLALDLVGVESNSDGVGARVFVTTPDGTTQVREQGGGMHRFSQDYKRLHFGLGGNTSAERIDIHWPSGIRQEVTGIEADQIIHILEGSNAINTRPMIGGTPATTTAEDSRYSFIPTAADENGDTLLFSISNKPPWATFNTMTGELSGVPTNADVGTTTDIVISVDDQAGQLNSAASLPPFDLTVTNVNDAPVANDDTASVNEGTVINIDVADNDVDVDDGLNLPSIDIVSQPENGELTVNTDGTVDYTHTATGAASDSFAYHISDVSGAVSNVANVNITISARDSNNDPISVVAPSLTGGDSGGGGGCVFYGTSGNDPVFPLFIFMSMIYLSRRHFL